MTVFGLQGLLMLLVSQPVQPGQMEPATPWGWVAYLSVAACAVGLMAFEAQYGAWGLLGPALITYLLTQVSGVPMLEEAMLKRNPVHEN